MPSSVTQIVGSASSQMVPTQQSTPPPAAEVNPATFTQAQAQQASQIAAVRATSDLGLQGKDRTNRNPKQVDGNFNSEQGREGKAEEQGATTLSKGSSPKKSLAVA